MGRAKSSRKGKKAWRANISTEDIDDYFEKTTKDALSGGHLANVPSDSLFYIDKSTDFSVKRKIEKHREKVLHCNRLLQRSSFVQPVPSSTLKKSKKKRKQLPKVETERKDANKGDEGSAFEMIDIWDDKGEDDVNVRKKSKPSVIPAVEVEPPGCSFNPPFEAHQDSLARAVAEEMQKVYKNELGPQPVPLTVPGEVMDEENMLFLDVDDEDDDELDEYNSSENNDTALEKRFPPYAGSREGICRQTLLSILLERLLSSLELETYRFLGEALTTTLRSSRAKTRVELNRRARRKEQLRAEEEVKKVDELSKEIDCVSDILQEIAKEDEEKQQRHDRRIIAKQERMKSGPPRLGKHKFQPLPPQVLLSEEISGSLRKLKGCCTLARDRFKSLEKRGLLVPTVKGKRK